MGNGSEHWFFTMLLPTVEGVAIVATATVAVAAFFTARKWRIEFFDRRKMEYAEEVLVDLYEVRLQIESFLTIYDQVLPPPGTDFEKVVNREELSLNRMSEKLKELSAATKKLRVHRARCQFLFPKVDEGLEDIADFWAPLEGAIWITTVALKNLMNIRESKSQNEQDMLHAMSSLRNFSQALWGERGRPESGHLNKYLKIIKTAEVTIRNEAALPV